MLPGRHTIHHLGLLTYGGVLLGLRGLEGAHAVEVEGSEGDVLLDCNGDVTVKGVVLLPHAAQRAVVAHRGTQRLSGCVVQGGKGGVWGMCDAAIHMEDSRIEGCSGKGVNLRQGTSTVLRRCSWRSRRRCRWSRACNLGQTHVPTADDAGVTADESR